MTKILPKDFPGIEDRIYVGFWLRFGAFWLDIIIMLPWIFLVNYINNLGRLYILYTLIPSYAFSLFYGIYTVKKWGGTPGKLIVNVKIVRKDGAKANWKEAILRYAVQFLIGIPMTVASIIVIFSMTDAQYESMSFFARSAFIGANMPIWNKPVIWANQIWIWSEFVVLLFNKRKRALHDFIAGTVVIKKKYEQVAEQFADDSGGQYVPPLP